MLPHDIVLSIVEHLDCLSFFRALQVCKRWNTLIKKEIAAQSPWSKRVALRMLRENNEQYEKILFSNSQQWSQGRMIEEKLFHDTFHNMLVRYLCIQETHTEAIDELCEKCKYPLYANPIVEESLECRNAFCWLQPSLLGVFRITKSQEERKSKKRRKIKG